MNEGALHDLPGGWVWTRLGEILNVTSGYGFPEKYQGKKTGEIPFFKVLDISKSVLNGSRLLKVANNYISKKDCEEIRANPLRKGTIVFAKIGEAIKLNRRAILEQDSLVDNNVMGIYPYNETLDNLFAFFFLSTIKLGDYSRATTVPSVRKSDVEQISIPLPPLPEQRAIVSKIEQLFSDLDNGIDNFKKAQAQLKLYRQSVLKAACEGRLVPTEAELARAQGRDYEAADVLLARILKERREKYKESVARITRDLSAMPDGWCWARVKELNPANRTCAYGVLQPGDDVEIGVPLVRVGDIKEGRIVATGMKKIVPQIAEEYTRTKLEGGEVLITLVGVIGRTAIVPKSLAGANTARAVGVIPLNDNIEAAWVNIFFQQAKKIAEMTSKSHEVARKTLNLEDVRATLIALPPLAEQRRIVAEVERRLSVSDKMEATIKESLQKAESLRQSILKKAFEGKLLNIKELEIARNAPDWEPAEKLMERIRQEKQIKENNNKPARRKTHG